MARKERYGEKRLEQIAKCNAKKTARRKKRRKMNAAKKAEAK